MHPTEDATMFESLRDTRIKMAAKSVGMFVFATVISTGIAVADNVEVILKNSLGETVLVNISGLDTTINNYRSNKGEGHPVGKAPDGKKLPWQAKPENKQSTLGTCQGVWPVKGKKDKDNKLVDTLVMETKYCTADTAVPPPKKDPPKTGAGSDSSSGSGSGSGSGSASVAAQGNNVFVIDPSFKKITVTFEYASGDPVTATIYDGSVPVSGDTKVSLSATGLKTTQHDFYKTKDGEYLADVSWNCAGNIAGASGTYRGKNLKLQFVQGCKLSGATKLSTKPTVR
jgi:hypothetical protein